MKFFFYYLLNFFNPINLIKTNDHLRVLAYHDIKNIERFECQLRYLVNSNYNVINISTLEDHLYRGKKLPNKSVLLTFDDGDISVLELGLPILVKYNLPSVMFIITNLIDSKDTFWCRWVEKALQNEGKSYSESRIMVNRLKKIPNEKRLEFLKTLSPIISRQLTKMDLSIMYSNQMYIANHTHTHPMVNKCTKEELENELKLSESCFKKWSLSGYHVFAYPNGNWDETSEKILRSNGIDIAFLFDHKINKRHINPMRISRIRINSDTEINEFKVKLSGLHSKLMGLKKKFHDNI